MSSSPDSIPPGWEEAISSSPETLPPGFENPNSLTSSALPPPPENQLNLTHLPPSPSPTTPQDSQIHQNTPLNLPQETPISLSPSFSPLKQENLDAMLRPPLQTQDIQFPLPSSLFSQGNLATEMGQMVCGSCNELLSYPRSSKYVQCACCQTINFVLEAHQLGIVKCGKCSVLLMYPYTSKSLRCSSCHYVTEIGPHNIRPPVSVLQGFPAPP